MNRKEIVNSQDYKATKAAMKYWHSLPEEYKARINNLGPEPDVIDAYEEGVIYGWNNPNWISVEDEPYPPKKNKWDKKSEEVLIYGLWMGRPTRLFGTYQYDTNEWGANGLISNITHWMPIVPPRKEE